MNGSDSSGLPTNRKFVKRKKVVYEHTCRPKCDRLRTERGILYLYLTLDWIHPVLIDRLFENMAEVAAATFYVAADENPAKVQGVDEHRNVSGEFGSEALEHGRVR